MTLAMYIIFSYTIELVEVKKYTAIKPAHQTTLVDLFIYSIFPN